MPKLSCYCLQQHDKATDFDAACRRACAAAGKVAYRHNQLGKGRPLIIVTRYIACRTAKGRNLKKGFDQALLHRVVININNISSYQQREKEHHKEIAFKLQILPKHLQANLRYLII